VRTPIFNKSENLEVETSFTVCLFRTELPYKDIIIRSLCKLKELPQSKEKNLTKGEAREADEAFEARGFFSQ
jgi:hypothetical protein